MAQFLLTNIDRVKVSLDLDEDGTHDDYLELLIENVSASVERWLGRGVQSTSRTELYDLRDFQTRVYLRSYPITTTTSVHHDTNRDFGASALLTASDDYFVDTRLGVLHLLGEYEAGPSVLQVVYTGGFADTTDNFIVAFPEVVQWVDQQVRHEFQRRTAPGSQSETLPQGGTQWTGEVQWLKGLTNVLRPMRAPRVA